MPVRLVAFYLHKVKRARRGDGNAFSSCSIPVENASQVRRWFLLKTRERFRIDDSEGRPERTFLRSLVQLLGSVPPSRAVRLKFDSTQTSAGTFELRRQSHAPQQIDETAILT